MAIRLDAAAIASAATAPLPLGKTCLHCGGDCAAETLTDGEKVFCCQGCYTVYQLLQQHALGDYYQLADRPGQSPAPKGRWDWLDEPQAADRLLDFRSANLAKVHFRIPSMHCASCIWLLERLYRIQPGILASEVNFPKRTLNLSYDPRQTSLRAVVELIEALGYAPALSMADDRQQKRPDSDRTLWYELGVAAFCFGNIMMTSFPEYFHIEEGAYSVLFRWINFAFSLPVLLFSARSYYRSAWQGLRHRQINMDVPIALGIIVLFGRSTYEIVSGYGSGYFDSLAGLLFFLLLGKVYQRKTFHLLAFDRDFESYFPISVTRLDGTTETNVPVRSLKVADRILVRHGELIPADAQLIRGQARIDYSFVTGEAQPVPVAPGERLHAGGRQVGEPIEMVLEKVVSQGYLTDLWNHPAFRKEKAAEITRLSDRIGQRFTPFVLILSAVAALYWAWADPSQIWNVVTAVLIVACPCALALSTPFALGHTLRILGRKGFYLKGPAIVERLAELDALIFDKTGTLTSAQQSEVRYQGRALLPEERDAVRAVLRASVHPLSRRLYQWLPEGQRLQVDAFEEQAGKGISGRVGPWEVLLGASSFVHAAGSGAEGTAVHLRLNGEQVGRFEIENGLRDGISPLLAELGQHYRLGLLSGDHAGARAHMASLLPPGADLRFRQSPADKLAFIQELQGQGHAVGMVGDGLNDAGALQQSDAGIAVTDDLTAFTPASDAILHGPALPLLPGFLRLSKAAIRMVKLSFGVSFLYNIVGISFAVSANLSPLVAAVLMPLSSLSVILFTTTGVTLYARRLLRQPIPNNQPAQQPLAAAKAA
jgi:Cu+-exporting ATPase